MRPVGAAFAVRTLLWLALACGAGIGVARAQVSPGPLASPHADLDGATQCFRCHQKDTGKVGMDLHCLDCHTEIAFMRTNQRGFHSRKREQTCASCHPDHGGRGFALVAWDGGSRERFDHGQAGWPLAGKHAALACRDCHRPAMQKSAAVPLLRVKDRTRSWLGLEPACASCHKDPHVGSLGANCASCHSQTAWRPAPGFDHRRTSYPLTGAHTKPACAECHATASVNSGRDAKAQLLPVWKPVPHGDCLSCHKDPHAGKFTGACARCHVTSDWKTVNKQSFDHDQTRYPLRGAHGEVKCERCHDARFGGAKPRFARCEDCHADAHRGLATVAGKPVACITCHDVKSFKSSTWPVAEHQKTRYPLAGAHAVATCTSCHTRAAEGSAEATALGPARVRMRPGHVACADCHSDPHTGRFSPGGARPHAAGCVACHSLAAFVPANYDGRAHADCVFPLAGAHRAIPCQKCHAELEKRPGGSTLKGSTELRALRFDSKARACRDCHTDAHRGQFAARRDKGACESCHGFASFVPASKFDHDRDSAFRLQGAHAHTPCAACHRETPAAGGTVVITYRPTPTRCASCHAPTTPDSSGRRAVPGSKRGRPARSRVLSRTGR